MALDRKLAKWLDAGVIDAATRDRIAAYERGHDRPMLLYALGGLGALTIGIGIVSIIAANWDVIGRETKLGADLLLGALLAGGLYRSATRARHWETESFAGVYYAFVLASIALIGQVYQLTAPVHEALLTWTFATAPFMLLVRTPLLGIAWLGGLVATVVATEAHHLERLRERVGWQDREYAEWSAIAIAATFVAFHLAARIPWLVRERPLVGRTWTSALCAISLLGAFTLCSVFYDDIEPERTLRWSLLGTGLLFGGFALALPRLYRDISPDALLGARLLVGATWLVLLIGTGFARPDFEAIAAIAQVVVLGISAWTVAQLGQIRLFNVLTGLIALRILFVYFEVFGSLMTTGLGLIGGGVLTLLLAWIWRRKSPALAARLVGESGDGVEAGDERGDGRQSARSDGGGSDHAA